MWPPILGQKSIRWQDVFALIEQPEYLYDVYKPAQPSFDRMDLRSIWECWSLGEGIYDSKGKLSGMKPPLCHVEQQFGSRWRKGQKVGLSSPVSSHGLLS